VGTELVTEVNQTYICLGSQQLVIDFCLTHFIDEAGKAIRERGRFAVALSGGSTPKKFYQALVQDSKSHLLDWSKIGLFWSDERAVAPDHPDSNYAMAMHFFSKPPFNQAKIFRMQAERPDRDAAAKEYEEAILNFCSDGRLDLVYLGLGEDGHIASLFPETKALQVEDKLVVANYVEKLNTWRMTMTYPAINGARNIVVLVVGENKAKILHEVLDSKTPALYPAQRIRGQEVPAFFVSDV
jgi:6-phosphogluconolactonase